MTFRRFATIFIHIVDFQIVAVLRVGDRYLYVVRRHRPAHNGLIRRITGDVRRCHAVFRLIRKRIFVTFRSFSTVFILIVDRQLVVGLLVGDRFLYVARRHLPAHNGLIRRITGDDRRWHVVTGIIRKRLLVAIRRCSTVFMHIVDRQLGGVLFIVERQRIRLFFKRDCLRLGMTIHRQEGIGIFIILPGSRGCNVLIRFLPHIARLVIRTDHFFSIIIDILYRINGRNLSNINLSVHVPC